MKRLTALILSLILVFSLAGCAVNPGKDSETQSITAPTEATAPDGRPVYSDTPTVEFPQTGEYKETALLTNVPGQGVPLLLDMREDGTIDYIFTGTSRYTYNTYEEGTPTLSFKEDGVKYYTIAPDGTATLHNEKWVEEIDTYVEMTNEAANLKNGKWEFTFAAEEGTILILAQFGPNLYTWSEILHTVLFKIENDRVSIVPIGYCVGVDGNPVDLKTERIREMRLENGYILLEYDRANTTTSQFDNLNCWATFRMDGTLHDLEWMDDKTYWSVITDQGVLTPVASVDEDGMIQLSLYQRPDNFLYPFTGDATLYNLGKYSSKERRRYDHIPLLADNGSGDFCCCFNEAGRIVLTLYEYNPEGAIDPEVLTVWSMDHIDLIETAVVQWNHTHATPIFRYETGEAELESSNLTEEDILTRLNLELLNNQGPDVMILDGLNVERYMEFMVPLNGLHTEGVYGSILDRFTVNDDLMALPMRTVPYLLSRLTEGTQQINSLEQFADMVTSSSDVLDVRYTDDRTPHGFAQYYIKNYNQLFRLWYPAWADAMWEDGKLNQEVFTEFIAQTLRLVDHYTLTEPMEEVVDEFFKPTNPERLDTVFDPILTETDFHYLYRQLPYTLVAPDYVGIDTYWNLGQRIRYNSSKLHPHYIEGIPGPDGTGVMVPTVITGVRAGGHEAEGLEFVQSLLSRELQLSDDYFGGYSNGMGYPVIWEYVETLIEQKEKEKRMDCEVENDYEQTITNLRTVIVDEYLFEQTLLAAQTCYRAEDRVSPEDAAEALYEATRIYLAELR